MKVKINLIYLSKKNQEKLENGKNERPNWIYNKKLQINWNKIVKV